MKSILEYLGVQVDQVLKIMFYIFVKISSYLHFHQEMVFIYFQIHEVRYMWSFFCFIFSWSAQQAKHWFFYWKFGPWAVNDSDFQCRQNTFLMLHVPCPIHKPFLCTFSRGEGSKCATWLGLTQQHPIIHLRNSWVIQNGKNIHFSFCGFCNLPRLTSLTQINSLSKTERKIQCEAFVWRTWC